MNIEILISIDGESLPLNDELQSTVSGIVNSYIKHKVSGIKPKKYKLRISPPRDPNAPKREPRPRLTDEEKQSVITMAHKYPNLTIGKVVDQVQKVIPRGYGTIYTILKRAEKRGELEFTKYIPKHP